MAGQLLSLPDMALEAVAAFASSEALPWVCRRLWEMLGHRPGVCLLSRTLGGALTHLPTYFPGHCPIPPPARDGMTGFFPGH